MSNTKTTDKSSMHRSRIEDQAESAPRSAGYCHLASGTILNNNYKVQDKLGKGTFSIAYSAEDKQGRAVAVKIYRTGVYDIKYFQNELKVLLKLKEKRFSSSSDKVCHHIDHFSHLVFENGLVYQYPCIVTNLLGDSIGTLLDVEENGLPIDVVKNVTRQILEGVAFLHSADIIIGDLKSDNVLMTKRIDDIDVRDGIKIALIDFNHSFSLGDDHGKAIGTQEFSAPEVVLELDFGQSADIWSVGCIAYELLTGCALFDLGDDSSSDTSMSDSEDDATTDAGNDSKGTASSSESSYDSSGESFDWDLNYEYLHLLFQLLGKPPKRFVTGGRDYYNRKGNLRHNPDIEEVDLVKLLCEQHDYREAEAKEFCEFLFTMIRYRPETRPSAEKLLQHPFLRSTSSSGSSGGKKGKKKRH